VSHVHPAVETARSIAREVVAPHADDVDKNARFPKECIEGQKKEKLLGAFIPKDLGGLGLGMAELAGMCEAFGSACGASGLVTAMHHIQVACIVRHGIDVPALRKYLEQVAKEQRLIASVTSGTVLSDEQMARLGEILQRAYGREVQLNVTVDPQVIGGLRIQVGPDVVDATVLSRLHDARRRLAS